MANPRVRIDIGLDDGNIVLDVWSEVETNDEHTAGTWSQDEHLVIKPPALMEKLSPGELDPRD